MRRDSHTGLDNDFGSTARVEGVIEALIDTALLVWIVDFFQQDAEEFALRR